MSATIANHQSEILERVLRQRPEGMTPEVAQYFLSLKLAQRDVDRMNELAAKSAAGNLSPAEEAELDDYRRCARLLDLFKLRARVVLRDDG
jgi:hypothetical protein